MNNNMIFDQEPVQTSPDVERKIKQFQSLEGILKKKRKSRFFGLANQSQNTYFAFFQQGRILAYWRKGVKPNGYLYKHRPRWACFTRNITRVEDNYQGKKNHFYIVNRNTKNLHIKIDNQKLCDKWVEALTFFSQHYKFAPQEEWEVDDFNTIDPKVLVVIMEEQEKKHMTQITQKLDTKPIQELKK